MAQATDDNPNGYPVSGASREKWMVEERNDFHLEAFAEALGFRAWPYSADTYTDGAGRFLDRRKAERLLGLPHSDLLFSEYDGEQQRPILRPFPAPKTMHDAMAAAMSLGWLPVQRGEVAQAPQEPER